MSNRNRSPKNNPDKASIVRLWFLGLFIGGLLAYHGYQTYWDLKINKTEWKTGFHADFPGLPSDMRGEERDWIINKANDENCSCDCGFTLASCLKSDLTCPIRSQNLDRVKNMIMEFHENRSTQPSLFRESGV